MATLFPDFPVSGITEDSQLPSRTYRLDIEGGRIAGIVDNLDAVNQMIRKTLLTPRFDCYAYDDQYGSEIIKLMRTEAVTREYIASETESMLEDALLADSRIDRLSDISCEFLGDTARVDFKAHTAFGVIDMKGEV